MPGLAGRVQQAVRRVLRAWRKPDPLTVQQVAHDQGWAASGAPRFTPVEDGIRTPPGRSAFGRAVGDAETVCAAVPAPADRSPALAEAVAILERIGEERVDAGGRVTDTGATATDPEARWGAKGGNRRGTRYQATVVEDHATACILHIPSTPANQPDGPALPAALAALPVAPTEVLGDGAYGTRHHRGWCRDRCIRLVAPQKGTGRGRVIGRILHAVDRARPAQGERKHGKRVRWHGLRPARDWGRVKTPCQADGTAAWANRKRLARLLTPPVPAVV